MELGRTFTLCVSHAVGAPLRPGPSSASGGGSFQTWLSVPSGFKGPRCSLRSPPRASTKVILRCIIAGIAEKKSAFPFRACSCVVHLAFLAPSSCMVSTQGPVKGLVVASVRGTTLTTASLAFVSLSKCLRRASAIVSHSAMSAMSAAIRRTWTGCESSPASFPTRSTSALAGDVVVV